MQPQQLRFEEEAARFTMDEGRQSPARIMVIGVGGAGGNAINWMVQSEIKGVELVAANTDVQALRTSLAPIKLQIGAKVTNGLGCGGIPERGRQAALEDTERIIELLEGVHMVFIAGGMGGGTCTGAAPVIASLATEMGALTVAVVTKPFSFLGNKRRKYAEGGIRELEHVVDAMITISNERLLLALEEDALLEDSLRYADDVLCQAVQGICDIITVPGIWNADFADVRTTMASKGMALMGTGIAEGPNRAAEAAQRAISSPLLEEMSIKGAKAVLINITGSRGTLKLHEAKAAATIIEEVIGPEEMILGAVYDDSMGDRIKITVIAMGFGRKGQEGSGNANAGGNQPTGGKRAPLVPVTGLDKAVDFPPKSAEVDLEEPAFWRRRAV